MLDTKQIGLRISSLRKQHNMTQLELADKLYVSYQTVSNWEREASVPGLHLFWAYRRTNCSDRN